MKVAPRDTERFLKSPPADIRVILIYGPDEGLVRERGRALMGLLAEDPEDPFAVTQLDMSTLREDPARLKDEAAAIPMMGGRKIVWLRGAEDAPTTKALKNFFEDPAGDGAIIVEAGELSPRAPLRKLAEGEDIAAAIACYEDDNRSIEQVIGQSLQKAGLRATGDAMAYLSARLGADRGQSRSELEKLALYMGPGAVEVSLEDAEAVIGDLSALTMDTIIDSAFGGDVKTLDQTLLRAFSENISEIAVLRMASTHLEKLAEVALAQEQGVPADQAMKRMRPPLYFKRQAAFRQHMRAWPGSRIATARNLLYEAERDCKQTGMPTHAICHRALLRLAVAARRG